MGLHHGQRFPGAEYREGQGFGFAPSSGAEPGPEEESPFVAATVEDPQKERTPRLD